MKRRLSYLALLGTSVCLPLQANICSTAHNGKTPAERKLVKKVEKHLYNNPAAHQIKVTIKEGVVGLCGTVTTNEEKQQIEADAKKVDGVSEVNSIISVETD